MITSNLLTIVSGMATVFLVRILESFGASTFRHEVLQTFKRCGCEYYRKTVFLLEYSQYPQS